MKRLLYLGYHIKNLDLKLFNRFLEDAFIKSGKSKFELVLDSIKCVLAYKISLLEYFQFKFFQLTFAERCKWAGTGYMYEYHRLMNPLPVRDILSDKLKFKDAYGSLIARNIYSMGQINEDSSLIKNILNDSSHKIVFKSKNGNCGKQVAIENKEFLEDVDLYDFMNQKGYDLVEAYINQHLELTNLSPNSVNTVRVITNLNRHNGVDILGCRLRMGIEKNVDNLGSGGIVAEVNEKSGEVISNGVYSDPTKSDESHHPISGIRIKGFRIPFWGEVISLVQKAALLHIENRSIGWDVAITESGPELIEGNHDWCKLVYQLPVKEGKKPVLEKYRLEMEQGFFSS